MSRQGGHKGKMSYRHPESTKTRCNGVLIGCLPNHRFQFMREFVFHLSKKMIKKETKKKKKKAIHCITAISGRRCTNWWPSSASASSQMCWGFASSQSPFRIPQSIFSSEFSNKIDGEECPIVRQNWQSHLYPEWHSLAAAAAKSLQSCLTLCDPVDCSLPGFSIHGILQARTLEWVAISFSRHSLEAEPKTGPSSSVQVSLPTTGKEGSTGKRHAIPSRLWIQC